MMPTSSGAHWRRGKKKLCVSRRTRCYKCPRLPLELASRVANLLPADHPVAAHPRRAPTRGPWRASPVRSRHPSSAQGRTAVSQQLTMVSATRPAGPVPALSEADGAAARAGPLLLLLGAARALLRA